MLKSKIPNAAGNRNNYVTVERASDADANTTGEVLPEWTLLCGRWVGAKITGGREFTAAMTTIPNLSSIQEMPYDTVTKTITPRDRINDDGRILNIAAVFNEGENNEKMILWLTEPVQIGA